jgi:hypothetical protein
MGGEVEGLADLNEARRQTMEPLTVLKKATSVFQADVWLLEREGNRVVRKTFEKRPWFLKWTIGRWLTAREARNLRDLKGIEGVPSFVGRVSPWAFEMMWVDAGELPDGAHRSSMAQEYFDSLARVIEEMHARGISHGDLRRRNLMRHRETGHAVVIDFTQSLSPRDWLLWPVLPFARRLDRDKVMRLRNWYLAPEEHGEHPRWSADSEAPGMLRLGWFLRHRLYRPFKHWYRGKKRKPKNRSKHKSLK